MKDIPGYENLYAATEEGLIWSHRKKIFLKQRKEQDGYFIVDLHKNKKIKKCKVHRLIALTFLPNPENKPTVDHIDRNKENNNLSNLRWASYKEQGQNKSNASLKEATKKAKLVNSKKVQCRDLKNHSILIKEFNSVTEAAQLMFNDIQKNLELVLVPEEKEKVLIIIIGVI